MVVIICLLCAATIVLLLWVFYIQIKYQKIKEEKDNEYLQKIIRRHAEEVVALDDSLKKQKEIFEKSLSAAAQDYKEKIQQLKLENQREKSIIEDELKDFYNKRNAIIQDSLRAKEMEEKENFYKIQLSGDDIKDIKLLESISQNFSHKGLIPKIIWDTIVSRPTQEMIKRVAANAEGGIYKITYIPTGEVYIGRTTNFATRFKNHVGTALGLEKAATSTLHTHMKEKGIWNYRFEVLEACSKEKQGEREKFYIDLYQSKKQLNMKGGG